MGLPKALLIVAATLFVASVLAALAALGVFFYYDTDFWDYFVEPGPVLQVAAAILSGLSVSSGLRLRRRRPPSPLRRGPPRRRAGRSPWRRREARPRTTP